MFGRCLFVCFQSRWSQVRERNISEAVLSLKLFYPVSNVCSSKCLNFFAAAKGPLTQAIFVAQLNAIFVALKLQLQYCTCKPAAISARF